MLETTLKASRYLATLAVVIVLLCAVVLCLITSISAVIATYEALTTTDWRPGSVKVYAVTCLKVVDLFLICIGLQVVAAGVYKFFVCDQILLPAAMNIKSFTELKLSLVLISSLVLLIKFVEQAVDLGPSRELMEYGIAIAAVLIAASWATKNRREYESASLKKNQSD